MTADGGSWERQSADEQGPIDLSGLSDALKELRKRVPQTAQAFDPKHPAESFEECEDDLAESTRLTWDDFVQNCAPHRDAMNKFRDKVRMWPSEMEEIRENTIERLKDAEDTLRDVFRRTITETQDGEPVAAPETVAVAAAEKEVQEARLATLNLDFPPQVSLSRFSSRTLAWLDRRKFPLDRSSFGSQFHIPR